jgi:hypothetical protein
METKPQTPQDYRTRAAACERLAATALSPENREIMRYLAMRWRTLADEDEAKGRAPYPQAQPPLPASGRGIHEDGR